MAHKPDRPAAVWDFTMTLQNILDIVCGPEIQCVSLYKPDKLVKK